MGQKITISPVTRIEGHARVTIYLNDDGKVEKSFFHVDQFRGFEKFSEGRMYFEMPVITPRICGICPVSHHLASAKACDAVAGVTPPRPATLLRELLHMGQIIQSHCLHFFHLASPDLILGFRPGHSQRPGPHRRQPRTGSQGRESTQVRSGDYPAIERSAHSHALGSAWWRELSPISGRP